MKALLIKGSSQYGVLRMAIDEVAEGFIARGWDVEVVDLDAPGISTLGDLADRLAACKVDLVFSINILGEFRGREGRSITEITGAPHVIQYVDYPLHEPGRLAAMSPKTALLLVDHSHVRMVQKLFKDHFVHLGFCAHGALGSPRALPATADEFVRERPISFLFAGTSYRAEKAPWANFPDQVKRVFEAAAEIALSNEWISPLEALDAVLKSAGIDPDDPRLSPAIYDELLQVRLLVPLIQEWVRRERRHRFVTTAARLGLRLTVLGAGWDAAPELLANIDYRGAVSIEECLQMMQRSRLVFSLSGNFGEGSHERPLSAMLAGAAVAADSTSFYETEFEKGRDIALFRWTKLESDLAQIAGLAADPEALFHQAKAGQAAVSSSHRWQSRADDIIAAAKIAAQKLNLNRGAAA